MREDQVLLLAQHDVQERRQVRTEQSWRTWRIVLPTLVGIVLGAFLAAPGALPQKLLVAMGGVCSLRPEHSYFAGDIQLPLEARMLGIYGGFLLAVAALLATGRSGMRRLGGSLDMSLLGLLFGSMVFDGINSTLHEVGLPYLHEPTNLLRLATGLAAGTALGAAFVWLLGVMLAPAVVLKPGTVVRSPRALLVVLVLQGVFAMLVIGEQSAWYYPLAAIGVGGAVAMLGGAALLVILALSKRHGRVTGVQLLCGPGALALLIAFALLAATATIRWSVLTAVA
jgi:uncharacterized membrane protein